MTAANRKDSAPADARLGVELPGAESAAKDLDCACGKPLDFCVAPGCQQTAAFASEPTVAALFVYPDGCYAGLPNVELWDEGRDARLYDGPHSVVAHPPCKTWCLMANCRPEIVKGEDGGCFEAALRAVRTFGGVLEHPARTLAWKRFWLPIPAGAGWTRALFGDTAWTCEVDQRWYGHEANKPTWLYYVGLSGPPRLRWGRAPRGDKTVGRSWGQGRDRQRSGTPPEFRDALLRMARGAVLERAA